MSFKMEFSLKGYQPLLDLLSPAELDVLLKEIEFEINDTLHLIFAESQLQVPVDTGLLKNSGKINLAKRDPQGLEGTITYSTDYALWVHEIPMNHDGEGEKDKYLEDPTKAQEAYFIKTVKQIMETYFGRVDENEPIN